jgi:hypothetical protein
MFKQSAINKSLEEIIKQDVSQHERLFNELQLMIPHTIEIIPSNEYNELKISEFMCFEYVFDLSNVGLYENILKCQEKTWRINPVGADKRFFFYLYRNNKIKEISLNNVKDGDWIIYYNNDAPAHAGKITKNRVTSKWGKGLLLEHEINEVPEQYGNTVRFFRSIPLKCLIDLFISYARERGIKFQKVEPQ